MAKTRYNFILFLLTIFVSSVISKDLDLQLGQETDNFNTVNGVLGPLRFTAFAPRGDDALKNLKDTDGQVLFAAGEHPVTLVFVNHDPHDNPSFTAVTFDGKFEHLFYKYKKDGQWNTADNGSEFFKELLGSASANANQGKSFFTLDLANLESNDHLELGLEHKRDNYELLLFKPKQDGHVFNEVKHGNHTLLTSQGDNLLSAAAKLFARADEKLAVLLLSYKNGEFKLVSLKFENGKWTEHDKLLLEGKGDEADALYKAQFVYT